MHFAVIATEPRSWFENLSPWDDLNTPISTSQKLSQNSLRFHFCIEPNFLPVIYRVVFGAFCDKLVYPSPSLVDEVAREA